MDGFVGRLGNVIGYRWRGRWCMRTCPAHVRNPRSEAQQQHRSLFREEVRLAARMRWPIAMCLTDEARRQHMTAYNLFVKMNQGCFGLSGSKDLTDSMDPEVFRVDYSRLQLSMGRVAPVRAESVEVDEVGYTLAVRFATNGNRAMASRYDEVYLYAYSPSAGLGYLFNSVYRYTGRVSVVLPQWLEVDDLQLFLMCRSSKDEWSPTAHASYERLHTHELMIESCGVGHEFVVGSTLDNAAVVEHDDEVGMPDGRKTVCN